MGRDPTGRQGKDNQRSREASSDEAKTMTMPTSYWRRPGSRPAGRLGRVGIAIGSARSKATGMVDRASSPPRLSAAYRTRRPSDYRYVADKGRNFTLAGGGQFDA